ncbi:hypothetical protein GCM10009416_46330 [Craurococcus roseus]|uniref:Calx-beta domain-containing protein n=1 Tax=Craurococcus roseus TaxID=77585 RepID=A0ABP3R4G9_9PROT
MPLYPTPVQTAPEFRANSTLAGDQYGSSITTLSDGGYVVAWAGSETPGSALYDIYVQRYSAAGAAVGVERRVNTNAAGSNTTATGFEHGPTVTGLADGGYVVSWLGPGTESPNVVAQRFDRNGAPINGEFTVSTSNGFHDLPTITALAGGGFVATWVGPGNNGSVEVRAQRFNPDSSPAGGEFVVNSGLAGDQGSPKAAGLAGGGFVVTWSGPGAAGPEIYAQQYSATSAAVGREFVVNTATAGDQLRPTVSALPDGGYLVAWVGNEVAGANNYDIFAQRYWADGSANGGQFQVNAAFKADINGSVDVTELSDRGFLVSWSGIGADAADIYAQRYLENGAKAGAEFRINADTAGYEYGPSVVGLASGGFAVTWSDKTGAGATADTDVFLKTFAFPAPVSAVNIVANQPAQAEGAAAATTAFTFTVTLDARVATAQTVRWQVEGAGASKAAAADFAGGALPGGTLTFAPGETSKTITVNVAGDAAVEWNEAFAVLLSDPSAGIGLAVPGAAATIVDDDATFVPGTGGDDVFTAQAGRFSYDGSFGHDKVERLDMGFRGAQVAVQADGSVLITKGADAMLLQGVEEVRFLDGRLAFAPYDPAAKVARLYEAALDRLPDQSGLNFWAAAVQNGEPLSTLASGFLSSPEFQARFGGATAGNGAFVDQLYLNVLGRAGEAEGRAFWVGALESGTGTRADVLAAFAESPENQAGTAALVQNGIWDRNEAAAQVARMYDTVLGRAPDAAGLGFWKNGMESGEASLNGMADSFTGSAEFQAKYGALDNRGFANALYVNTLDRPADQAGLDFWTAALNNGEPRSSVVLAFSESPEHVALTAPTIGGEARTEYGIVFV